MSDDHLIRASSGECKPVSGVVRPENGTLAGLGFTVALATQYGSVPAGPFAPPDATADVPADPVAGTVEGTRVTVRVGFGGTLTPAAGDWWLCVKATGGGVTLFAFGDEQLVVT